MNTVIDGVIGGDWDSGAGRGRWGHGAWHENGVMDGVTEDNGDGSGGRGQGVVELEAQERLGLHS